MRNDSDTVAAEGDPLEVLDILEDVCIDPVDEVVVEFQPSEGNSVS